MCARFEVIDLPEAVQPHLTGAVDQHGAGRAAQAKGLHGSRDGLACGASAVNGDRKSQPEFMHKHFQGGAAHDRVMFEVLIDGKKLTELMMDFGVGVIRVAIYTVQKIDPDYFGEE